MFLLSYFVKVKYCSKGNFYRDEKINNTSLDTSTFSISWYCNKAYDCCINVLSNLSNSYLKLYEEVNMYQNAY